MKKIFCLIFSVFFCFLAVGCSNGVSQETYYALQNELNRVEQERDELLQYAPSDALEMVQEEMGDTLPGMVFSEISTDRAKILQITAIASFEELSDVVVEAGESFGEILGEMVLESWFDYDYIYLDIAAYRFGKLYSLEIDCSSMSMQVASWEDV